MTSNRRRQWQPAPVLLPGKSHGRRSLVGSSPQGRKQSDTTEQLHFHFSLSCIGKGNGNLLQCSCLENPRDGGAWWAAVYGVTQSRTRLKRLSSSSSMTSNTEHPSVQFSSVQSLSPVRLFATPWTAARQASLSITNSRSSLRLTSIELVMPSSHLIPFSSTPNPSQHQSLFQCMKVKSESEVAQSCPTVCDPVDWSLPGSSVHGIFQARVLERVAIAFSDY